MALTTDSNVLEVTRKGSLQRIEGSWDELTENQPQAEVSLHSYGQKGGHDRAKYAADHLGLLSRAHKNAMFPDHLASEKNMR